MYCPEFLKQNPQHDGFSDGESEHRLSLNIDIRANYGDISLSLPRYFRGPITIRSSHERVAFSPALEERMAPISDVQGVRVYFVGNRPRSGIWRGDINDDDNESKTRARADPPKNRWMSYLWTAGIRVCGSNVTANQSFLRCNRTGGRTSVWAQ